MTAVTRSQIKKSFFKERLKSKFSEDMKLFITNLVFQLLSLPILAGVYLWLQYLDSIDAVGSRDDCLPFVFIAVIAFILSVLMGLVIPMMNFRYLYSKSLVDMNYSLPLNNRQRFFADYFSGLTAYIAPFLIGGIIALAELLIGSCFVEIGSMLEYLPEIIKIAFIAFVGMIMLYTMSVLAISFAGSVFEALFSIVALNIMIPLFIFITWSNIVEAAHFGLCTESVVQNYTFFTTSPIGVFGFIIPYIDIIPQSPSDVLRQTMYGEKIRSIADNMYFNFMVRTLAVIVIILFITYLLYKHRKAEDVSKPYVYNAFYYIIMSAVIYSIVTLMKMTSLDSGLIAALIISGIIWFTMEVIRRRGFKRFWTALLSFAAASVVVIGVIKVIDSTRGLGRAQYVPSASSVTDIEIEIMNNYSSIFNNDRIRYCDHKVISDAIDINTELVDRYFNSDKYEYELSDYNHRYPHLNNKDKNYLLDAKQVKITYHTKGGSAILRQYWMPSEMLSDLCCDIYTSSEFAEQETKEMLYNGLRSSKDPGHFYTQSRFIKNADSYATSVTDKLGVTSEVLLTVEEGKELTEALCKDYTEMTSDDFRSAEYYCTLGNMIVNSSCDNTIAFLKMHNIAYRKTAVELFESLDKYSTNLTITPAPEYVFPLGFFTESNYESNYSYDYPDDKRINTEKYVKMDSVFSVDPYRDRSYVDYGRKRHFEFTDPEAVEKLLDAATPVVTGEKVLAEIQAGSLTLYITERTGNDLLVESAKDSMKLVDNATAEEYDPDIFYQ
ncbi:hypothetical protein [Ruminococcus flavefaciens]|uniref:hypothetical protein n=1 Tax=Ruminococcus flavefaciens TaxID=1265 RepID=UPI0026F015C9|nr:hypothetical protein [Ruminococcus flavefaciens]